MSLPAKREPGGGSAARQLGGTRTGGPRLPKKRAVEAEQQQQLVRGHTPANDDGWSALSLLVALTGVHALFFAHIRFRLPIDLALIAPIACWLADAVSRGERCEST